MTTRNRRRKTDSLGKTILAVAVVGASLAAWGFVRKAQTDELPPNAFYEVKRGDLLISVLEDGALRALTETVIRNNLEGMSRIIQLAPEGSHVKKGDLLVELDSSAVKDKLNELEVAYQDQLFLLLQAQENLKIQKSLIESRIKDGELNVEFAGADLAKYRDGDAPQKIALAQARLGVLEEQVRIATDRYARTQVLFKNGNATRSELEADSLSQKREQLGLEQTQEDLRLFKKFDHPNNIRILESNLQQAKDELERLKHRSSNEIAQAEADLKTSQRALGVMEESVQQQKRQLENAKILAPQEGLVVYAASSPFQGRGEGGREEGGGGRRGMRGDGGFGGGFDSGGGFRGGGERRGRSRSGASGSSGSGSSRGGGSSSSVAQGTSSGASGQGASAGSAAGGSSGVGAQTAGSGGGGGASASSGGRSGGGSSGGGASPSFASYGSIRQSIGVSMSGSAGQSSSGTSSSLGSSASYATTAEGLYSGSSSQGRSRFSSQSAEFDLGSFSFLGTSGFIEEGTQVRQRQELIRLPDVSRMLAEVKIPEARVRQVRPGMLAYVRIETLPGRRFKGTVRRVGILPDAQSTWLNAEVKVYATDVLIEDELPELKPGVSARAQIIITNLPSVLSVPIQAVTSIHGDNTCFVKRGSSVVPVSVTTGWFNDRLIEVTSGLKEGDRVLLAPMSDPDDFDTNGAGAQTNETASAQSAPASAPNGPPPGSENRAAEPSPASPGSAPGAPPQPGSGFQRGDGESGDGRGGGEGGRGRRGRRQMDPEMQRQFDELMKLSPEEREERMREFRGRRGQGSGRSRGGAEGQTPPQNAEP